MVEAFLAEKATTGRLDGKPGGLGPSSIRRFQVTLHKALDEAVRKGLLASNPVDRAVRPKMPRQDATLVVWHPDDIARWIEATSGDRLAALR